LLTLNLLVGLAFPSSKMSFSSIDNKTFSHFDKTLNS
jgi:hypothetical protein